MSEHRMYEHNEIKSLLIDIFPVSPIPLRIAAEGKRQEEQEVEAFFSGITWRDIDFQKLWNRFSGNLEEALFYMCPEAKRYYLPAFLLVTLCNPQKYGHMIEPLCFFLTLRQDGKFHFEESFEPLTLPQKQAVAKILDFWRTDSEKYDLRQEAAQDALDSYWSRFVSPA